MRCATCPSIIDHPGICDPCGREQRITEHGARLGAAIESIPIRCRSAKWGSIALAERVPDLGRVEDMTDDEGRPVPVSALLQARIVVIHGDTGAGKTSLAAALLRLIIDQAKPDSEQATIERARRCRFVDARDIPPGAAAPGGISMLATAAGASVLLLDDVGQEAGTGESFGAADRARVVADLLNYRDKHGLQTIVTTYGAAVGGVAGVVASWARYGAGVVRRYLESGDGFVIELHRRR